MIVTQPIKIFVGGLVGITLVLMGLFYLLPSRSKIEAKSIKIAVVDSSRIKIHSLPFARVRDLLEKEHERIHAEILAQETKLRKEHETLKNSKISAADKQKKKLEFDKKVSALEQQVQKTKEQLSQQFSWLTEHLESTLNSVIEEIVKEYGFNLVLNKTIQETRSILYNQQNLDITSEVIKRLDRILPDLKLPN